jgi:hypothetical protein
VSVVCIVLADGQLLWSLCGLHITKQLRGRGVGLGRVVAMRGALVSYIVFVMRAGCSPLESGGARRRAARSSSGYAVLSAKSLDIAVVLAMSRHMQTGGRSWACSPSALEGGWTRFSCSWGLPRWFTGDVNEICRRRHNALGVLGVVNTGLSCFACGGELGACSSGACVTPLTEEQCSGAMS